MALRQSEERLRLLIESASGYAIMTLDGERKITTWSSGAAAMLGYTEQEMVGQSGDIMFIPEDREKGDPVKEAETAEREGRAENERWHLRKDGSRFWASGVTSPIRDHDGKMVGFVKIMRDLTERKKAEKALQESEERKAFLLKLSDALRPKSSPVEIQETVASITMDYFGTERCYYGVIEGDSCIIKGDAAKEGLPSVAGVYSLNDIPVFKSVIDAAKPFTVDDVHTTDLVDDSLRQLCLQLQVVSFIDVPVIKNGVTVGILCIVQRTPKEWTEFEVKLAEEVAERMWAAIERTKAEEALRESVERFRKLSNAVPQVIWSNDAEGKANYFNQRWYDFTGLSYEESFGVGWIAIVHPDDALSSIEKWNEALADGQIFDVEYRLRNAKGQYCWFVGRNVPLKDDGKKITGWFGSATDINDLKNAEEALRQSKEQLRLIINSARGFAILTTDTEGIINSWSPGAAEIFGWTEEEIIGRSGDVLFTPEDRARRQHQAEMETAATKGIAPDLRWHLHKSGSLVFIHGVSHPVYDASDKLSGFVKVGRDITAQHNAEKALRETEENYRVQLEKEVEQRTAELREMNTNLRYANENLQQFASIASHDLQEPLRKMKMFASLLNKHWSKELPDEGKDVIRKITVASDRMGQLIREVLEYSKIAYSTKEFQPSDLHGVLQNVLGDLDLLLEETGTVVEYENQLPVIEAIPLQMHQLFYNLVNNAVKFRKEGVPSRIRISAAPLSPEEVASLPELAVNEDYITISFSDDGIGFDQQFAEQIFQIFERLHTTDEYEGTGVGLALCKKIVENHRGHIIATSRDGEGAEFRVVLPIAQ